MDLNTLIIFLLIGAAAGWIAGLLMRGGGFGVLGNIVVGIVGAVIGGFLFNLLGESIGGGLIGGTRCWDGPCEEDVQTIALSAKVHLVDEGRIDMVSKLREALGRDLITVLKMNAEAWAERTGVDPFGRDPEEAGGRFADHCIEISRRTGHPPARGAHARESRASAASIPAGHGR